MTSPILTGVQVAKSLEYDIAQAFNNLKDSKTDTMRKIELKTAWGIKITITMERAN